MNSDDTVENSNEEAANLPSANEGDNLSQADLIPIPHAHLQSTSATESLSAADSDAADTDEKDESQTEP